VLALTLGWGCDYTPDPIPAPSPSPPATDHPVIVIFIPDSVTFRFLTASPTPGGTIPLRSSPGQSLSPTIEFYFSYPHDLTLGEQGTDFQVSLLRDGAGCMVTRMAQATRLDRDDGVYLANSKAQFRTGVWTVRSVGECGCGPAFTTDAISLDLWPLPDSGFAQRLYVGWSFAVR
jgi:hypothetical protein